MNAQRHRHTFMSDFRTFFLKGLAILLPSLVTLALLLWAYNFLRTNIAEPINGAVRQGVLVVTPYFFDDMAIEAQPDWFVVTEAEMVERAGGPDRFAGLDQARRDVLRARSRGEAFADYWRERWWLQGIGFVVAIVAVYLAGVLVGNYLGRRVYVRFEGWLVRVPVIKQVYPNVKQIVQFLIGDEESKMPTTGKVVLVEYPRRGIWTVGLMTGGTLSSIESAAGKPSVTVFIPSSPTPFTGYTINLPADEVRELDITFDEAIRFVVSGGVLVPPREKVERPAEIVRSPNRVASAEEPPAEKAVDVPMRDMADSRDADDVTGERDRQAG